MLAGSDVAAFVGDSVGVLVGGAGVDATGCNGVDVGDSTSVGVGIGAAQASKITTNTNTRGINVSGTTDFRFTSTPLFVFNSYQKNKDMS